MTDYSAPIQQNVRPVSHPSMKIATVSGGNIASKLLMDLEKTSSDSSNIPNLAWLKSRLKTEKPDNSLRSDLSANFIQSTARANMGTNSIIQSEVRYENTANIGYSIWVDTQVYLYGEIIDAGGKDNPHIHLNTDKGVITLHTSKAFLQQFDKNLLYKKFGVRVAAKQDAISGETDYSSAQVLEIIEYEPKYDEKYLNNLIEQATPHWDGVNVDTWLREVRGNYDE